MNTNKLSCTYRLLKALGFNYSEEEYGQVTVWTVVKKFFFFFFRATLLSMMNWAILEPVNPRKLRPRILKWIGCHVGKNVFIGDHVRIDAGHADLIFLEDNVHLTGGCRLLCHQRDISQYCVGDDSSKLKYRLAPIHLKKGCLIGMETFIMPGVTVGEGAIVGAGSLVTKDIPAWTIATGRPARVVKKIPVREKLQ